MLMFVNAGMFLPGSDQIIAISVHLLQYLCGCVIKKSKKCQEVGVNCSI